VELLAQNKFLTKAIVFTIAGFFSLIIPLNTAKAASDNQTGGINLPMVVAESLKVGTTLTGGSSVPLVFTLDNTENRGFFDIGYRVYLVDARGDIYLQKDFSKLYAFAPFEKRNVESTFDLPKGFPAGGYSLRVAAISPSGADLGQVEQKVNVSGSGVGFVTFGASSISSGGQQGSEGREIAINPQDTVNAHITVNSTKELSVRQMYVIYPDENFSLGVTKEGDIRTIKAGENKYDFSFKSPETGGNYNMAYWLEDGSGMHVSPIMRFGIGVWGGLPGINYISVDKLNVKKGESIDVEVAFLPAAARENLGAVKVKVWVGEDSAEKDLDFSQSAVVLVPVLVNADINSPIARVVVNKDGKSILDYKTVSKVSPVKNTQNNVNNESKGADSMYLWIGGILVLVILFAVLIFVKNKKNTIKVAAFLLFGFAFLFILQKNAFASVTSGTSWTAVPSVNTCSPPSGYFYIKNFFIYINGSATAAVQNDLIRPGDSVRFVGNLSSGSAFCTFFGTPGSTIKLGGITMGSGTSSWDFTVVVPDTLDTTTISGTASVISTSAIRSSGTAGGVSMSKTMTFTFGPKAIDGATMSTGATPACSNSNYNMTFNFTGRALATNYDVEWSTDSTYATGVVTQTFASSGGGAKTYTTTGTPFAVGSAYYWRVRAYNSNAGSAVVTSRITPFGPVAACPPPTVTLAASPNPVAYNTASTLTWTISNATSCTNTLNMPTGNWLTLGNGFASTGNLTANKTYTLTCTNAGGSTSASVTVTVNSPPQPSITSCSISPATVSVGQNVTISATIRNNLATAISTQLPDSGYGYTETQTYATQGFAPVSGKFRVGVDAGGGSYPWRWGFGPPSTATLASAASVTVTGTITMASAGTKNLSIGLVEESIAWRATGQCPTTVTVNPAPPTVTLTASPNPVAYNTASTLTWTISGSPTSCTNTLNMPAGSWSTMTNGSASTGPLIVNTTYTLTCTNAGGPGSATVTVTVNPAPLVDPSTMTILTGCLGNAPQVQMRFKDNSDSEDLYYLDVNTAPWTGDSGPSPWGVKTITSDATQKLATNRVVTFIWKNTAVTNTSGPMDSGSPLVPANNTTYYWRVMAHNSTNPDSNHIYPPSATVVPGTSFTTPTCTFDMKAQFDDTTWKANGVSVPNPSTYNFQPGDTVSVIVNVTNLNTTGTASPGTDLYLYYQAGNPDAPICPSLPSPPGHAATTVPGDAAASANQGYLVPSLNPLGSAPITVTFKIGTTSNTATAYVVPKCELSDSYWPNNVDSQSYTVSSVGFIETQGGDVGAAAGKAIRMAYDSSTISKYQSDYLIAAGTIDPKVNSKNNWELNTYGAKQVPTGGIYDYFKTKFPQPVPAVSTCDFVSSKPVSYCNNDFTFDATKTAPTWDSVIFVDDDLRIQKDLILPADTTLVFIVGGNITVSLGVKEIDGIFISKQGFADSDVSAASSGVTAAGALNVKGAVYIDANGGVLSFNRFFTDGNNTLLPAVKFLFEPKYLAKSVIRDQIGVKSIKWAEVAP